MNNQTTDLDTIFRNVPGNYLIVKSNAPHFTIVAVTDLYLKATQTKREEIIGRSVFDVFPDNPRDPLATGVAKLTNSFEVVIREKKPHQMAVQKYDIPTDSKEDFELKYWLPKNIPVVNDNGDIDYIVHTVVDITQQLLDHKEIEELKLDQKVYEVFINAPTAIAILKGDNNTIELANNTFLKTIGKTAGVIGRSFTEALPELESQGFLKLLMEVKASGKPYYANEVAVKLIRNGKEEVIYVNFVYQPYKDNSGSAASIVIIATEVTGQVNARKKVEESEQQLRNLIMVAPVATALYIGEEMKIQYANEAMLRLWGKDSSVIGKILREALPELEGQPFHQILQDVYTTGNTYWGKEDKGELVVDGTLQTFYFNFTYKALRNLDGTIYGIINTAVDVTEQVLSRKKLVESEARLRLAVEAAHLGTYEFDMASKTVVHSARTAEIMGYDRTEKLTHEAFVQAIYPADAGIRVQANEEALKTGNLFYEVRILLPDNTQRWIKVNGKQRVVNGYPTYTIGTVMDITDEKRNAEILEQKIKERTSELEKANELLGRSNAELEQIANAASHDLKEPLRKIRTFNQLIKKESVEILSERSMSHLEKSSEAAERMTAFLDGLLEYSELKKAEQLTIVDLNSTVTDVLNDLELVVNEKNAEISLQHLPALKGIPHQLYQLFYNLINNALKFSRAEKTPTIDITCRKVEFKHINQYTSLKQENEYFEIVVKDNGIGFNQQDAEQIFTIFKRLHSKSAYKGTGIGLALCKKVVLNHGGNIFAVSLPDEGSAFHIVLPIQDLNGS